MNSVILIGNGFDLAHGLKTGYRDFIDDFWKNEKQKVINELQEIWYNHEFYHYEYADEFIVFTTPCNIEDIPTSVNKGGNGYSWFNNLISSKFTLIINNRKIGFSLKYNNLFLKNITENSTLKNWSGIEAEYYYALNNCLNNKWPGGIIKLNDEFLAIQKTLEKYLSLQMQSKIEISRKIKENLLEIINIYLINKALSRNGESKILFLNFNYTNTLNLYKDLFSIYDDGIKNIHIHGEIGSDKNPIIFGYGDEMNDNYKLIENKDDNDYLENIKSSNYSKTSNYQNMLKFIYSGSYEILIFGHSCGLSDRTLLHNLFENKNCKSIKIYYHIREDGTDDHNDIYKNISRHFNDKEKLREIVVDKASSLLLS